MRYTEGQQCAGTLKGAATLALRDNAFPHAAASRCKLLRTEFESEIFPSSGGVGRFACLLIGFRNYASVTICL